VFRIRKFFGPPGPLLIVQIRIFPLTSTKLRNPFISKVLGLLNDLLSLKTDVNVKKTIFSVGILKAIEETSRIRVRRRIQIRIHNPAVSYGSGITIRTKTSRTRNTAIWPEFQYFLFNTASSAASQIPQGIEPDCFNYGMGSQML
jgi:hypothetical protein